MGKIGDFRYPEITLSEAIKIAQVIIRQYRGTISTAGLAQALGMSERGGGFLHKMAALRDYGLVEGRGTLKATPRAERIILPNSPGEAARAAVEAFIGIELFAEVDGRLGDEVPDAERLAILLGEITSDRIQARRKARGIRRYYADYVPYLRDANATNAWGEDGPSTAGKPPTHDERPLPNVGNHQIELRAGPIQLRLPRSQASIAIIRSALDVLERELREEQAAASSSQRRVAEEVPPEWRKQPTAEDGENEVERQMVRDSS